MRRRRMLCGGRWRPPTTSSLQGRGYPFFCDERIDYGLCRARARYWACKHGSSSKIRLQAEKTRDNGRNASLFKERIEQPEVRYVTGKETRSGISARDFPSTVPELTRTFAPTARPGTDTGGGMPGIRGVVSDRSNDVCPERGNSSSREIVRLNMLRDHEVLRPMGHRCCWADAGQASRREQRATDPKVSSDGAFTDQPEFD